MHLTEMMILIATQTFEPDVESAIMILLTTNLMSTIEIESLLKWPPVYPFYTD